MSDWFKVSSRFPVDFALSGTSPDGARMSFEQWFAIFGFAAFVIGIAWFGEREGRK